MSLLISELLKMAETRLIGEDCMSPRLDAEVLLCHTLKVDKSFLFAHFGDPLDDRRCEQYFKLIDQRAARRPVAYILGSQEFMGLPFSVDERVLIPRPDTETLVEQALELLRQARQPLGGFEVLDLCTGSGAIAVSLAYHLQGKKLKVTATDLSEDALTVARENAEQNKVDGTVSFVQGDLFDWIPRNKKEVPKKQFDLITANPPYVRDDVLPALQREIVEYEPPMALLGGTDGLDFYRRIVKEAPEFLKKNGALLLEIGHDQGAALLKLIEEAGGYEDARVRKDLAGNDRVVYCRKADPKGAKQKKKEKKTDQAEKLEND